MANFIVKLFQQLDRTFPLQGANHDVQETTKTVNKTLIAIPFDTRGVNPATGSPMLGSFDMEGNPYGMGNLPDHITHNSGVNPATGLPMCGMFDTAGHTFGE